MKKLIRLKRCIENSSKYLVRNQSLFQWQSFALRLIPEHTQDFDVVSAIKFFRLVIFEIRFDGQAASKYRGDTSSNNRLVFLERIGVLVCPDNRYGRVLGEIARTILMRASQESMRAAVVPVRRLVFRLVSTYRQV